MRHKIWPLLTLMLLVSICFCLSLTAHAQVEIKEFPPLEGSETEAASGDRSDEIASLTSLIVMYSEQLEEYDRSNGIFVATCISLAGVILGLVVSFSAARKGKIKRPSVALSSLFAILPAITTLCLYVFSMQCRRVAYFRGYLAYLEEKLSGLIETPIVFNSNIVPIYLDQFPTNKYGPIFMGIAVVILFSVSIGFCIYNALPEKVGQRQPFLKKWGLIFLLGFILLACTAFCIVCLYDLCTNGAARQEVYDYCISNIVP